MTIPPVEIVGSAEKDLVKRYDAIAAADCKKDLNAAIAGCAQVASAVGDHGIFTAGTASLACTELVLAYDDCKKTQAYRHQQADGCEASGGVAVAGISPDEVVCLRLAP